MRLRDVIVVGAGPGGSAAAAELGRQGLDTLLLDSSDFPRDKTCGDALTPRALRMLDRLGLLPRLAGAPRLDEAVVVAPDGTAETAALRAGPLGPSYVQIVPRLVLDEMLLSHAVARGAQFASPVHVQRIEPQAGHVAVTGDQGGRRVSFQARAAIVATGARWGLLAQMGRLRRQPRPGLAVRAYFEGLADLSPHQLQFRFDGVPMPGYAWIFPIGPAAANIGLGLFGSSARRRAEGARPAPRALFERWLQSPAVRRHVAAARLAGPIKGYPIRSDFLEAATYAERVLVVGEAAGLVNPLTGDGIDFALETGHLAAEHLARQFAAGDFSRRAFAAYDRQLRRRYCAFFGFCLGLRRVALDHPRVLNRLVRGMPNYPRLERRLIAMLLG